MKSNDTVRLIIKARAFTYPISIIIKNNQQTRLNNNIFCFIEPHSLNKSEWQKNPRFERMYHHHTHPEIEYKYYIPQKDAIIKKSLMRMKYMATCKMLEKITEDDAFLNVHMKPYFM